MHLGTARRQFAGKAGGAGTRCILGGRGALWEGPEWNVALLQRFVGGGQVVFAASPNLEPLQVSS